MHVSVEDLAMSKAFYSALFGVGPVVEKDDYAKWMVDDPRINFAISTKADRSPGLNHLGIQAEEEAELNALNVALGAANIATPTETCARCCYAESDKHWAVDPDGIRNLPDDEFNRGLRRGSGRVCRSAREREPDQGPPDALRSRT